jgi:16S rRNA C967 or C1407 C5-methylase (RsmB/RsmF family)
VQSSWLSARQSVGGQVRGDGLGSEARGYKKGPRQPEMLTKAEKKKKRRLDNAEWKQNVKACKVSAKYDPNLRYSKYYQSQLPFLVEEWEVFQKCLCTPLPVTFRHGASSPGLVSRKTASMMNKTFKSMKGRFIEVNGNILNDNIVSKTTWFDGSLSNVWQTVDHETLSKNPGMDSLKRYLSREVALGHLVRQELSSMIPPLFLASGLQSRHNVLDVCAAPGSKSELLLHLMQELPDSRGQVSGMVIANDADPHRIETLMNRFKRCPNPNLVCTCNKAEEMAKIIAPSSFKFDRILADVPCSGDGTVRKMPHIWRLFRPRMALELHSIQLQIAKASIAMLKPGGRFCYSTCSINPMEDEAVVSALLQEFRGAIELVNTRKEGLLPNLKSRPGLSHWSVSPETFVLGEEDEEERKESLKRMPAIIASMHPPSPEDAEWMHLDRCHRILPHDIDGGGFFVALFEMKEESALTKVKELDCDSYDTMKALGYNPRWQPEAKLNKVSKWKDSHKKTSGEKKMDKKGDTDAPVTYEDISSEVSAHLQKKMGFELVDSSDIVHKFSCVRKMSTADQSGKGKRYVPDGAIFGSKKDGWRLSTLDDDEDDDDNDSSGDYSAYILSQNTNNFVNMFQNSIPIRQAGARLYNTQEGLNDDCSRILSPLMKEESHACIALNDEEFSSFATIGAKPYQQFGSNMYADLDLVNIFLQMAHDDDASEWSCLREETVESLKTWFDDDDKPYLLLILSSALSTKTLAGTAQEGPPRIMGRMSKADRKRQKKQELKAEENASSEINVKMSADSSSGPIIVLTKNLATVRYLTSSDKCFSFASCMK